MPGIKFLYSNEGENKEGVVESLRQAGQKESADFEAKMESKEVVRTKIIEANKEATVRSTAPQAFAGVGNYPWSITRGWKTGTSPKFYAKIFYRPIVDVIITATAKKKS